VAGSGTSAQRTRAIVRTGRRLRRRASAARGRLELLTDPSYRRLADGCTLASGDRRVYCYHVRKTAGTSLFLSFLALGGEDPMTVWRRITASRLQRTVSGGYGFAANDRRVLAEGAYLFGRSHRSFADQPVPPGTFTVTILRDPVARVHSYYDYLVAGDEPGTPGQVAERERRLALGGFDAFLDRVPVDGLLTQLAMFSDRLDVAEAVDRIGGCSSVFFTEDFTAGLARLSERLGLPLEARRERVTARRSTLTPEQRDRLAARLEPEYELLRRLEAAGVARLGSAGGA
jgi:hypothetical protein